MNKRGLRAYFQTKDDDNINSGASPILASTSNLATTAELAMAESEIKKKLCEED